MLHFVTEQTFDIFAHFCQRMAHCKIFVWHIVGFVIGHLYTPSPAYELTLNSHSADG